jgi:hypothetical protein
MVFKELLEQTEVMELQDLKVFKDQPVLKEPRVVMDLHQQFLALQVQHLQLLVLKVVKDLMVQIQQLPDHKVVKDLLDHQHQMEHLVQMEIKEIKDLQVLQEAEDLQDLKEQWDLKDILDQHQQFLALQALQDQHLMTQVVLVV